MMAKDVWSTDYEDFNYDSLEELLNNKDLKAGDTVYCGESVVPAPTDILCAEDIIDIMSDRAYEIAGDYADGFPNVSEDDKKELDDFITAWINRHSKINFYLVKNTKPYVLSDDDFKNNKACEG